VPLSNFAGWFLVVYIIFQCFALYLRSRWNKFGADPEILAGSGGEVSLGSVARSYWYLAVVFYAVSAVGNILLAIPRPRVETVLDATGVLWRVRAITATCALVSIFTMGAFAVMAWARVKWRDGA